MDVTMTRKSIPNWEKIRVRIRLRPYRNNKVERALATGILALRHSFATI